MLVIYDVADGIATLTLNRPEVANAQNMALLDELDRFSLEQKRAVTRPLLRTMLQQTGRAAPLVPVSTQERAPGDPAAPDSGPAAPDNAPTRFK